MSKRWWPGIAIPILTLALVLWIRSGGLGDTDRQYEVVLPALVTLVVGALLFVLWFMLFTPLRFGARVAWILAGGAVVAVIGNRYEYRGVSGDFLPMFGLREAEEVEFIRGSGEVFAHPDYPQFLGPNRDGRVDEVQLETDWDRHPPRLIWRRAVGRGWSGFAVSGELALTLELLDSEEHVVAYRFATGEELWRATIPGVYLSETAGDGPRSTPTVAGGRIFAVGGAGGLLAVDLDGEVLWERSILVQNGAAQPVWGSSGSPLVLGSLVVVNAGDTKGRSLVAYDAATGDDVFGGGSDAASYASPVLLELGGAPQIVIVNHASIAGHSPDDGALLWSFAWSPLQPNAAQPLPLSPSTLLVSSGYGEGAVALEIVQDRSGEFEARQLWRSRHLKSKFSNMILYDGVVFGLDDGVMCCIDPADGRRLWKDGRFGHGQMILSGEVLLVLTEQGEVVAVDPDPGNLIELGRFQAVQGKTWNHAALAGRYLLVRNDRQAAMYELPVLAEPKAR